MRILAIVAGLALAGCAQQQSGKGYSQILQSCGGAAMPFTETWPCVRAGMVDIANTDGDVRDLYIAKGDYIAVQVREGKMTDAEAKLAAAEARQHAGEVMTNRQARIADRQAVTNAAIMGAYISRPQPTYQAPSAPVYTPRQPINCYMVGNVMQCY